MHLLFFIKSEMINMLYIIKNISEEKIAIGKLILCPNMEIKSMNINPFKNMIEQGYLKIINRNEETY